ncbi:MAG: choice-of-anchor D domain-containing protein [Alphaproteobacteria bacterium]
MFKKLLLPLFALAALLWGGQAYAQYAGFNDPGTGGGGGATGAGLVPAESEVDGGSIPIGASAQVVVLFRNDGGKPVEMGLIQLYPSSTVTAEVASNQCEAEALPSGAECAIALSVKGLQPGPWRVEMLMAHSGRTRLVTNTISGVVESGDGGGKLTTDIEAIPSDLDFGTLSASQTLIEPIVLRNITSVTLNISDIYLDTGDGSGYSLNTECASLKAGQACIASVKWSPELEGRSSGVLVVKHDGPAGLTSIPLKGEYSPGNVSEAEVFPRAVPGKGLLVSSQRDVDFGSGIETASALTVSLVNAGDAPVTLKNIRMSSSDNGIGFKEEGCAEGTILAPVEACPLTITWSPTRVGSILDDVQILHDGARGVLVLPIRGTASTSVSKDQKAIVLSDGNAIMTNNGDAPSTALSSGVDPNNIEESQKQAAKANSLSLSAGVNAGGTLDGYKITSFSPSRAIINGPGGSRLVFDREEIVLGGVPWFVVIQKNGIEFLNQGQRILLLFDRSLSSANRTSASGGGSSGDT